MRPAAAALACTFVALLALPGAVAKSSPAFGEPGAPRWAEFAAPADLPSADRAGEPTIGIPWNTGSIFYIAYSQVYRIKVNDTVVNATWEALPQANPVETARPNLDPMLHADPETGRVWAGGLYTACSLMSYSDDDGATWSPSGNMCGVYGIDHQTIGSGPWVGGPTEGQYPRAVYYCAHGEGVSVGDVSNILFSGVSPTACLTSRDGGVTWGPPVPWVGGCGSLHGHVKVGPKGFAAVPDADCAKAAGSAEQLAGFAWSNDNGLTWNSRTVAGSVPHAAFNNPGLDFGHGKGWLWYGQAADDGAFVALSKDNGTSWEKLGPGANTTWLDVGRLHDPPIVAATFAKVVAGDDDRVAFSFLGVEQPASGSIPEPFQCDSKQELLVWHYYVAMSYDAGASWRVQRLTEDPVQVGGIWQGQGGACRNLLDFNDMDVDAKGRLTIGFADGCTKTCAKEQKPKGDGYRGAHATILHQLSGNGLFAAYDVEAPGDVSQDTEPGFSHAEETGAPAPTTTEEAPVPGLGGAALVLVLAGLALLARRR
ncbi:MAG: sialidase family protein [Thermoplasmatota archaeon]|nr:glycoside hydrolase [Halobacteriales archaeon]